APYGFKVVKSRLVEHPTEDLADVVVAFRDAGTYNGAARLLTERGVRPRKGGQWRASAVRGILTSQAPEVIPTSIARGRPPARAFRLAGLLRCPCSATLTGRNETHGSVAYECGRAAETPGHAHPRSVAELK